MQEFIVWQGKTEHLVIAENAIRAIQRTIETTDSFTPASLWNVSLLSDYSDKAQLKIRSIAISI